MHLRHKVAGEESWIRRGPLRNPLHDDVVRATAQRIPWRERQAPSQEGGVVTADGEVPATPGPGAAVPGRPPDEVDEQVIALLQRDGRMSYACIGREVGLSEGAVRQRVQRL